MRALIAEDDPISRVVWSGSPDSVTDVWVDGVRAVADGRPTRVDVPALVAEVTDRARRLSA